VIEKAKILIVDDEESIRFTFETFLSRDGHQVVCASDYGSAVELIQSSNPDLIFADIVLGNHSGIELLKEVRDRKLKCPVIMITGQPNIDSAAESVRLGAFDYLAKPINKETLLRVARIALENKALKDEKQRIEIDKERYRRQLEAIFRSIPSGIITVDQNLYVHDANEAVQSLFDIRPEDIIGKSYYDIEHPFFKLCAKMLDESLNKLKVIQEYRIEYQRPDSRLQTVIVCSSPLIDQDNNSIGALLVGRDVTRLTDLERELKERHQFCNIIGKSNRMQDVFRLIENLSDTETNVLITGETGTGKGLIAKALHYNGPRAAMPMVTVNCSALAENLLESELFGHVKGAFTGAVSNKIGRFQAAHNGTVFLDEIGEISPMIQVKLLRVLQDKEFECVGDSTPIRVDVRVIAATNKNLKQEVRSGRFREDLYYRLKVVEILMPPLREKLDDVPLLVNHFINMFNKRFHKHIKGVSGDVMDVFMNYAWPGNIRELEHAIEHAFVLCQGDTIKFDHIPSELYESFMKKYAFQQKKTLHNGQDIFNALKQTGGNKAKAARLLGISRQTLYRKMRTLKDVDFAG